MWRRRNRRNRAIDLNCCRHCLPLIDKYVCPFSTTCTERQWEVSRTYQKLLLFRVVFDILCCSVTVSVVTEWDVDQGLLVTLEESEIFRLSGDQGNKWHRGLAKSAKGGITNLQMVIIAMYVWFLQS